MVRNRGGDRKEFRWSMYPNLHERVPSLLQEDNLSLDFHNTDDNTSFTRDYDTHIMGRFNCRNPKCSSTGWSSKKISITIRMYHGARYNARVYHQRCQDCNGLSRPLLDKASYAERVAYRLKKWSGIEVDPPAFSGQEGSPHQAELCEGCKAGHCRQMEAYIGETYF